MSQAAVAIVQDLYAAYQRGEIQAVLDSLDPEVRWAVIGRRSDHPTFGEWPGRGGAAHFFKTVAETFDFTEFTPHSFYGAEDKVFVMGRYQMTNKRSGKSTASDWIHVITVKDGLVTEFREFTDTAQIAEAHRG